MAQTGTQWMAAASKLDAQLAHEFAEIVLGMDLLYRSQGASDGEAALDQEGLVPINLTDASPRTYGSWVDVTGELTDLQSRYVRVEDDIRRNYMQQQIGSVMALATWASGEQSSFRNRVRGFLYVNENPMTNAQMARLHEQLNEALERRGYTGSLETKISRWREERKVPPQQLESILKDLFREARSRVVERMFAEIEDVDMEPVVLYSVPYSAYCDYVGRKMYINGDLTYTFEGLKHLVCHEAYPGHSTHMRIRELGIQNGSIAVDAGLVITNTASSSVFEGIGDNGMTFIEWQTTEDDRINHLFQLIRSVSGANAAHMMHQQNLSDEEVAEYLRRYCFAEDAYIQSRLRFLKHRLRAPFIYSYWRGYEAVRDAYKQVSPENRAQFFSFLYQCMLSADTVRQFVQ